MQLLEFTPENELEKAVEEARRGALSFDDLVKLKHFYAKNRDEARKHLREKFGDDISVSLKDVEAAERPR